MAKQQYIGVLDCNNFFVSCERLFRPDLHGKPVVVLSSNDGCVVARSQEVKDMGIPMGVPYFQIKDILDKQKVTVFSSHLALYRDVSRRVFEVLRKEITTVEQYSVDEAFFVLPIDKNSETVARAVRDIVQAQVGVPVSIGVGFSKTQAKSAVTVAKKGSGVHIWSPATWEAAALALPLASIWGVGAKLEMRAKQHSLQTVADYLAADSARIQQLFGVVGVRLQQELAGVAIDFVGKQTKQQQSIMSSRSFKHTTVDRSVVADAIAYHVRHIATSMREQNVGAIELRVSIHASRHGDFVLQGGSKSAVFNAPTNDTIELLRVAAALCDELFVVGVPYKKVGVVASGLQSEPGSQTTLFEASQPADRDSLLTAIDAINAKSGLETIVIGSRLRTKDWGSKVDARSPAYTTRWSDLASVKA